MGKGLKKMMAVVLMLAFIAAGSLSAMAATSVDSSGAMLYARGQTAYYVSPDGWLLLSGVNPVDGEMTREFINMGVQVKTEKGSLCAGDDFIAYIDPVGGFGMLQRYYVGNENPLAAAPKTGTEAQMVAAGTGHLMVLNDMGEVRVYGRNDYGQLGNADGGYVMEAQMVVAGEDSSFAIDMDNNLYAWGRNHVGQLGVGDKEDRYEPTFVMSNVKEVWTSGSHSFARTYNGVLYGWGSNTSGQIGFSDTKKNIVSPQKLGTKYVDLAAGKRHTLFFDKYGNVYASGSNQNYELGLGSRESQNKILDLKRTGQALAAGDGFSLIVTQKSGIFAGSGRNDKGQLGLASKRTFAQGFTRLVLPELSGTGGSNNSSNVPASAANLTGVVQSVEPGRILVEVTDGAHQGPMYVSIPQSLQSGGAAFYAGDQVKVYFDGVVASSYPGQVNNVYDIQVLKGAEN